MQNKDDHLKDYFVYVLIIPAEQKLTITEGNFILAFLGAGEGKK